MYDIEVDPAALDAAHVQILLSAGKLSGLLEGLAQYLAPMQATWTGSAASAANTVIEQWNTNAATLNELLIQIGTALDGVGENYTAIETGTTQIWQA